MNHKIAIPERPVFRACKAKVLLSVLVSILPVLAEAQSGDTEQRRYKIAQSYPYPPWDVGPYEGVSTEVATAICEANRSMDCRLIAVTSERCFDSDVDGDPIVGADLASGRFDGCLTWFRTPAREQLGAEFGHAYSTGSVPQLIASDSETEFDALGESGDLGGATVAFFAGFFSDATCLQGHYTGFEPVISASDDAGRSALLDSLDAGTVDLVFWDNVGTIPDGTHPVGEPVTTCGRDELGLAVFPPSESRRRKSDWLRRDWNCGLALIRLNGLLEEICSLSPHPGGDPACILEGPPPTEQCLAENSD
jgi:hypothetical protein